MVGKAAAKSTLKSTAMTAADSPARPDNASDFPAFAAENLLIRSKDGAIIPLELNAVQRRVHGKLEGQLKDTGRVRALILKARQPGVSTYVEARYYWWVTRRRGVRAYILTHLRDATDAIAWSSGLSTPNAPEAVRHPRRLPMFQEFRLGD
jgi:hypothetical protein